MTTQRVVTGCIAATRSAVTPRNNNNNFNDNRGQEGPIVKIRRIIQLTEVLYVGYSMHN